MSRTALVGFIADALTASEREDVTGTPTFIRAEMLVSYLELYEAAYVMRQNWYEGESPKPEPVPEPEPEPTPEPIPEPDPDVLRVVEDTRIVGLETDPAAVTRLSHNSTALLTVTDGAGFEKSIHEKSENWGAEIPHNMRMTKLGLQPGTEYSYTITFTRATDTGMQVAKTSGVFQIPAKKPEPLPKTGSVPFIGQQTANVSGIANETISNHQGTSTVFKVGGELITHIWFHSRRIGQSDLDKGNPAKTSSLNATYKRIYDLGVRDPIHAAFCISNPYSRGNYTASAAAYHPQSNGLPDLKRPISEATLDLAESYFDHASGAKIAYRLQTPFRSVEGQRVCGLLINQYPMDDPRQVYSNVTDIERFIAAHPKSGAAGINCSIVNDTPNGGVWDGISTLLEREPTLGPYYGHTDQTFPIYSNDGQNWRRSSRHEREVPMMGFLDENGMGRGPIFTDYNDVSYDIEGNDQLRYRFTLNDEYNVNGLILQIQHSQSAVPKLEPLTAKLHANGLLLASLNFKPDEKVARAARADQGPGWSKWAAADQKQDYQNAVHLHAGTEHTLTLSARAGAGFVQWLAHPFLGSKSADCFQYNGGGTFACEYSSDGGRSWSGVRGPTGQSGGWMFI